LIPLTDESSNRLNDARIIAARDRRGGSNSLIVDGPKTFIGNGR
jgi:hypothetical protein